MVRNVLCKMGVEPEIQAAVPFLREEDGSPYQVWKLETAQGNYVLKKTSQREKEVYEAFLSGCNYAPKLYASWQEQGETWLLMEYIAGETMSHCTREKLKRTLDALISGQKQYWQNTTLAEVGYRYDEAFRSRCRRLAYLGEEAVAECYSAYLDEFASVPRTLCNDDLLPFNVLVDGERAVILDWADAGILPYPCALARLLAVGVEEPDWIFQMTQADREFALDYYYENLIEEKGISRSVYDRTMKLFFFKEYSEWICCATRSGDYDTPHYKKYAPMAEKLARELMDGGAEQDKEHFHSEELSKKDKSRQEDFSMLTDYHIHTEFSDDSDYPMEQVVRDAIAMGLDEICFTDHVDYGIKRDWDDPAGVLYRAGGPGEPDAIPLANVDYPRYEQSIRELQQRYGKQISLKLGLEFGVQTHTIPQYQKLFAKYPFDFIILSVHEVEDKEFWNQDFQAGCTQQEYIERYYAELLALVQQYHDYSVLGHMDLIVRYDQAGSYPFEKLKPILTEILQTVIADGKGIEVNTSSHRYGLADLTPARDILKLYRELGGRIVTIGSDSHKPEHLGAYVDQTKQELRELGFTEFCTFEKMQPIFHAL